MPDAEIKPISFSAYWTDELGEEIKRRAIEQCPDGYHIRTPSYTDSLAIVKAWNQGIDSHLEALTESSTFSTVKSRYNFNIHPEELHVLVRRLMEMDYEDGEAHDLASSICSTLGIELI